VLSPWFFLCGSFPRVRWIRSIPFEVANPSGAITFGSTFLCRRPPPLVSRSLFPLRFRCFWCTEVFFFFWAAKSPTFQKKGSFFFFAAFFASLFLTPPPTGTFFSGPFLWIGCVLTTHTFFFFFPLRPPKEGTCPQHPWWVHCWSLYRFLTPPPPLFGAPPHRPVRQMHLRFVPLLVGYGEKGVVGTVEFQSVSFSLANSPFFCGNEVKQPPLWLHSLSSVFPPEFFPSTFFFLSVVDFTAAPIRALSFTLVSYPSFRR